MSPDEIADDMMLYRMTSGALVEIRKHTLQEMMGLVNTEIGHDIRVSYGLWDVNNPYTASGFDPSIYDTVDDNPKHPHNVTRQILTIVWRRLQ
jgi:hypothetical protein